MFAAVFLDRDGTINIEKDYLYRIEDWEWIGDAKHSILKLNQAGYLVIVVTNQSGVARGLYNLNDIEVLHQYVNDALKAVNARIDGFYYCPHHESHGLSSVCNCRKPKPGLFYQAKKDFSIDFERSWMIGDKLSDLEAAQRAGITNNILVKTGHGSTICQDHHNLTTTDNLDHAVNLILKSTGYNAS